MRGRIGVLRGLCAVALAAFASHAWGQAVPACSPLRFDGGSADGFTVTGLWHVSSVCGAQSGNHSTPYALYYGIDGQCDFNNGSTNSGEATSPPMSVSPGQQLRLNSRRAAETGEYDITEIQYSIDDGSNWTTFVSTDDSEDALPNDGQWHAVAFTLPAGATGTGTARFRFTFDTEDDLSNEGLGWMIDDIEVCSPPYVATSIPTSDSRMLALMASVLALLAFGALRRRSARR